ncbi:hypothetical protein NIBR502774_18975 (plasmid) [Rhizobium sp. NIBRBAC000502774]|nr:hypothetical protein NIBR502774_18975 [Rhizobium sp. NIBRBAC000502774]
MEAEMKRPPRPTTLSAELLDVLAHMQAANNAALMALAKTLEEAGAMKMQDYEKMLRFISEGLARQGSIGPATLVDDLADMMKRDEVTKQ